tara:strand:- start:241 stop:507 length:267 start_codon:yes stop_codon:yes gene_type:complete
MAIFLLFFAGLSCQPSLTRQELVKAVMIRKTLEHNIKKLELSLKHCQNTCKIHLKAIRRRTLLQLVPFIVSGVVLGAGVTLFIVYGRK